MLKSVKGKITSNTIILEAFNIQLTPMDRSTKHKISKETKALNDTIDQLDLIDIYSAFHHKTIYFTLFSSAQGIFSRIGHILGHEYNLGRFLKLEISSNTFSDHNGVKLDIEYRGKKLLKNTNVWRLSNRLHSNQNIMEKIKKRKSKYA